MGRRWSAFVETKGTDAGIEERRRASSRMVERPVSSGSSSRQRAGCCSNQRGWMDE